MGIGNIRLFVPPAIYEKPISPFYLASVILIESDIGEVHQRITKGSQEITYMVEKWLILVDRYKHQLGLDNFDFLLSEQIFCPVEYKQIGSLGVYFQKIDGINAILLAKSIQNDLVQIASLRVYHFVSEVGQSCLGAYPPYGNLPISLGSRLRS